ncbi:MAG: serine/threonine protein kinase [Ilumatobacteraceae bacterium]
MAAEAPAVAAAAPNASAAPSTNPSSTRSSSVTNRLGQVPLGSARTAGGSRPTRRLGSAGSASRLGAGFVHVPPVPILDPRQALMDPAVVAEEKRFCSVCQSPVGRARDGSPGRTKGFCPKCRTPFDFDPKLSPGTLLGGQYEIVGCLAHGGMGWIYLARDRNVNDRWVVVKGLLNAGDPDAFRAAVAEKQFLAEVEHPVIVEIYNFVAAADGASYIIMEYVGGQSLNNLLKSRMKDAGGRFSPIPVDQALAFMIEVLPAFSYLHGLGLLYCDFKPANVIQVGDGIKLIDLGGVRRIDDDVTPIYGTVGFQAPEVPADGTSIASDIYTVARTLAVLIFEFKGYQNQYVDRLPSPDEVPLFVEHDSLYRLLLRATAPRPEDRFHSAEELRQQCSACCRGVGDHRWRGVAQHPVDGVHHTDRRRRPARVGRPAAAGARRHRPQRGVVAVDHHRRSCAAPRVARLATRTVADGVDRAGIRRTRDRQRRGGVGRRRHGARRRPVGLAWRVVAGSGGAVARRCVARRRCVQHGVRHPARRTRPEARAGSCVRVVGRPRCGRPPVPGVCPHRRRLRGAGAVRAGPGGHPRRAHHRCAGRPRRDPVHEPRVRRVAAQAATILASVPDDRRTMQTLDAAASELAQSDDRAAGTGRRSGSTSSPPRCRRCSRTVPSPERRSAASRPTSAACAPASSTPTGRRRRSPPSAAGVSRSSTRPTG